MSQSTPNIKITIVTITPQYAEELLGRNPRNRILRPRNLANLERAMLNGEWELNGEAIKVDTDGFVLDGQHRLHAVVNTGVSIQTILVEGLPSETQDTMDTGKSRTLADILQIRGEANATALAALIRRVVLVERHGLPVAFLSSTAGYVLTNRECLEWFEENQWVRDYVHPGRKVARHSALNGAGAGVLMWYFEMLDTEDAQHFFARLIDGVNLTERDPIHVLRKAHKTIIDDSRGERNQRYIAAITIKAWNAYREGREISMLKFRPGGANPESFPEPK